MGKIYYIFGKSSSGKDTIYRRLLEKHSDRFKSVVPYTTRPRREGEEEGIAWVGSGTKPNESFKNVILFALHHDGTVGVSEGDVIVHPYTLYPNPAQSQLRMAFSPDVQPSLVLARRAALLGGTLRPARPQDSLTRQRLRAYRHEPTARWHLHPTRHPTGRPGVFGQGGEGIKRHPYFPAERYTFPYGEIWGSF